MSNRKPTLGYPSRTDAVLAMTAAGRSISSIAEELDIAPGTVHALLASGARRKDRQPRQRPDHRTVVFDVETLSALAPHAERRRISTNMLVRRIVQTVVESDLIDSVLDDIDELAAAIHEKQGP